MFRNRWGIFKKVGHWVDCIPRADKERSMTTNHAIASHGLAFLELPATHPSWTNCFATLFRPISPISQRAHHPHPRAHHPRASIETRPLRVELLQSHGQEKTLQKIVEDGWDSTDWPDGHLALTQLSHSRDRRRDPSWSNAPAGWVQHGSPSVCPTIGNVVSTVTACQPSGLIG